jgi:peptidyl-prolyl cis-trans isomerase D
MLKFFRKHSQSFLMWLLVGAIGFIFIVQFGPQSRGCRAGAGKTAFVAKVYGNVITEDAFRWAWIISRAAGIPREQSKALRLKEAVLDGLIERELLAAAAENLGIKVTESEIDDNILSGVIFYNASIHSPIRMPSGPIPIDFTKEDGSFDYETFKMFVNGQFQMSLTGFKKQQIREVLADRMRKILETSVELYPGEVREKYEKTSNWVKIHSATFDPMILAKKISPSAQEIKKWAQANEAKIKEYYDANQFKYKSVEKQVRVRNILIRVDEGAEEEVKEEKRAMAESIFQKAENGEDFSALAGKHSEDEATKSAGGDNGYRGRGYLDEVVEDAAFGMKAGEVKGPLETAQGFQIIKCEGFREGDIPLDDVRLEIAEQLMVEKRSEEEARGEAEKFLALLTSGEDFDAAVDILKGGGAEGQEPAQDKDAFAGMPTVRTSSEIGRGDSHIPGVGAAKDLVAEIFGMDEKNALVKRVVEVNGKFHVISIQERHAGSDAEFLSQKDALSRELIGEKRLALIEMWIDTQRKKAEKEGAIKIDQAYLRYPGDETANETGD